MKTNFIHAFINVCILASTALLLHGCTDRPDEDALPIPTGNTVPVTFSIGIEHEQDGYHQGEAEAARAAGTDTSAGFDAQIQPDITSRADAFPGAIYKLYVFQFNTSGTWMNGKLIGDVVTLGTAMTMELSTSNDCQLLFIALGNNTGVTLDTGKSLSEYQELFADMDRCNITGFATDGTNINNQPYILHLPHVKISSSGIESPGIINGSGQDVRIRLKRLAAKLNLRWTFNVPSYTLTEVRVSQVSGTIPNATPNHAKGRFYFFPSREADGTYPTMEKEYVDYYRLKGDELKSATTAGGYTVWIPASARGTSSRVTAPQHRNQDNAPKGACYVEFVADKIVSGQVKARLFYRVYLGGAAVNDFNIYENTNYTWNIKMSSANVADPRIIQMDMTPATSTNLRNTSNCFMVIPGSNFCFNPYRHEADNSVLKSNTELVTGSMLGGASGPTLNIISGKEISSVKILWQSRDNGTSGELVLGRYISSTNHTNIINYENLSSPYNARVFVKVPVTQGGNAVIAAYNSSNEIVWSWHLWITDYVPERMKTAGGSVDDRYKAAQSGTQNGTVHKYRSSIWQAGGTYENMVMMDRDLGTRKGGYPGLGKDAYQEYTVSEATNRQGLLYQWGRKDPFFGSADGTTNEINVIFDGDGTPINITKVDATTTGASNNLLYAIQHPLVFLYGGTNTDWWDNIASNGNTEDGGAYNWNANGRSAPGVKTIYDPSPEGWKVPMNGSTLSPNDLLSGTGIWGGMGAVTGSGYSSSGTNLTLTNNNSYFTYAPYYSQNKFYQYETTMPDKNKENPKGGRIFFLKDNIYSNPSSWTIHNTLWVPVTAERNGVASWEGKLSYPTYGHIWTADISGNNAGFLGMMPNIIQLGAYTRTYGWSVRCIQDNK